MNGLAFSYMYEWLLERISGNKEKSSKAIQEAISILENNIEYDQYISNMCYYSYALELWLEHHDFSSISILKNNIEYFYSNGFYRSLAQSISILSVIYARMQSHESILELSRKIFSSKGILDELPNDIKAILQYFTGLGFMLNMNLSFAESFFEEAYNILKPIYKDSIYFSNFIIVHSYIVTVKALQGNLKQTIRIIEDVEKLLQQEFFLKNLDTNTKRQIHHTLNLNKFYVYSRMQEFDSEEMQDLISKIFIRSKSLYSDFMLLSEFILNANLESAELEELLIIDNFSIARVKHLISFTLLNRREKATTEQQFLETIRILKNRKKTCKTTFIENAFADLLIAQQLFLHENYGGIYPLLRKYENQLHRIEVLELRIFMEAFIQVGAYKNGDPLGPALQYMAIKKCQEYGFSRLENKLLDYLFLQGSEALRISV